MTDDRAVSEVLGFVLTFSLITMTVAIVFTAGIGGLQDAQQAERANNVERAFDVLAHNFEDVHRRGAPSRATEIKLAGGELGHGERTTMTVEVENESVRIRSDPLVYTDPSGVQVAYEAGAVIRTDDGDSVMVTEPGFVIDETRSNLPLLRTTAPPEETSVSGGSTVLVRGFIECRSTECQTVGAPELFEDGGDVTVTVTSPRYDAWETYFDRFETAGIGTVETMPDEETVVFTYETDRVSTPVIQFRVEIQ